MANNGYRPQYPPRGPQSQQRHAQGEYGPPPQQQYYRDQHNPPPRQQYPPRNDTYNQFDERNNGYYNEQQYRQNGHYNQAPQDDRWDGGRGEEPSRQYGRYEQRYEQEYREERSYQNNGQHRMNGPGRPQPHQAQSYGGPIRQGERPPVEHRSKEQKRAILRPESPKTIPWDNPFGAFPTKRKPGGHDDQTDKQRSPETQPAVPNGRPSTSNSGRERTEPGRPHTSHGQRQPQGIPPQHQEEMPLRKTQSRPHQDEGFYEQPNTMSDFRPPPPQRAMTGPGPPATYNNPARPAQERVHDRGYQVPMRQQSSDDYQQRQYREEHNLQSQPVETYPLSSNTFEHTQDVDWHQENYRQETIQDDWDSSSYRGVPLTKKISSDVPDFDRIATPVSEKVEHQLSMSSQPPVPYRKPVYPTEPLHSSNDYRRQPPHLGQVADELSAPLSQFSFVTQADQRPPMRPDLQVHTHQDYEQKQLYRETSQHPRSAQAHEQQSLNSNRYPPRSTSHMDDSTILSNNPHNQSTASAGRGPLPRAPTFDQARSQPEGPNSRFSPQDSHPHREQYSQHDMIPVVPGQGPNGHDRAGYDPRLVNQRPGPAPSQHQQQQHQQYQQGPPRPRTSNSNQHPSANPHERRVSTETFRSNMTGRSNPDSLPAHPVPFRPGLMQPTPPPPQSQPQLQRVQSPPQQVVARPNEAEPKAAVVTIQELNNLRESFKVNPNDHALGLKFAKRLVEAARVLANDNGRADPKQTAKNRERYILDAHKIVKKLIGAGYPEAMFFMADCYGQGLLGLQTDPKEAFSLYQSAAKLGHAQGAYRVAVCCELGPEEGGGTRRDPMKAVQWYKRAATLGDSPAMYKMGMIQLKGLLGQPKNPREAITWLKRAAERADAENPHALHELALLYESAQSTDIVIRDEKYALQLFNQAADLGYKYSQFRLGSAYEYGLLGCPIDARMSIAWYSRAASQGEHQSEFALSGWYLTGSGQPSPGEQALLAQSDTEAYLWARKAATSGLVKAEYAMGYYTEVGIGVAANVEEAKKWYFRAAAQNHPKARERLEELKRGGARMQKARVSRSNVGKQNEGECIVM